MKRRGTQIGIDGLMGQRPEEALPCRTIEQGHEDIFIKTGIPGQGFMVEQAR
ncbi:hypothetical protein [Acidithiobacillus sulfuriphilus]|uniref:hypothetical protein n=1 Tax=Acidithiobacillus sulfuriphilus TaxID=1867749 RepID=UPI003F5F3C22